MATLLSLTFTAMQSKETSRQPFSNTSILPPSYSSAFILLTLFQAAWWPAALWRLSLSSGGPFVAAAFGGIKKGASAPPFPALPPPFIHSSGPHCLEGEGAKGGKRDTRVRVWGGVQKCEMFRQAPPAPVLGERSPSSPLLARSLFPLHI